MENVIIQCIMKLQKDITWGINIKLNWVLSCMMKFKLNLDPLNKGNYYTSWAGYFNINLVRKFIRDREKKFTFDNVNFIFIFFKELFEEKKS